MITIINVNPYLNMCYCIDDFTIGQVHRCDKYSISPGGKGLNVAKVCRQFEEKVYCMGFLGGTNGDILKEKLKDFDISSNFTTICGNTRRCINILDSSGESTKILEEGPNISDLELIEFEKSLGEILKEAEVVVMSGSLSRGVPENYYKNIGKKCNKYNVKFILDTSGRYLRTGLEANPFIIKPNKEELESLFNIKINSLNVIKDCCNELRKMGAENVAMSLGEEGMIFIGNLGSYMIKVPKIDAVNSVGSGDALVAGLAVGIKRNYDVEKMLRFANSCGVSNAMNLETGYVNYRMVKELEKKINIIKI